MMKKLMSVVVAVLLIMCVTCPVFAAGSNDGPVDIAAKGPNGEAVDIEIGPATEIFDIPVEDGGTVDFGDGDVVPAEDLTVVYQHDLHSDVLPVTITFDVPTAGPNDILHVMHYTGSAWEQVAKGTGTSVEATFTSLSPVSIVLQTVKTSGTPGTGDDEKPTSPQTGMDMTALFASAAVMLMAGVVAFAAKKHVKD